MKNRNSLYVLGLALIMTLPSRAVDPMESMEPGGSSEPCARFLAGLGRANRAFQYEQAFASNIGLFTPEEQQKLRNSRIAIIGMGGVGGIHLITLARMGVGGFNLADPDKFELKNFNRQYGADMSTVGESKVEVLKDWALRINPELRLNIWNAPIDENNLEEFLSECDLVVDGLDAFATDLRRAVFTKAREMGITVITAGPIGFSTALLVFTPESMSYEDYFDYGPETAYDTQVVKFLLGLTPRPYFLRYMKNLEKFKADRPEGPSVCSSVDLCAGFAAVEAVKVLLHRGKVYATPYYHYYDPYLGIFKRGYLYMGNRNPIQRLILWYVRKFVIDQKE